MGLLDRISAARTVEQRYSVDDWISDLAAFSYNGHQYLAGLNTTYDGQRLQAIQHTLPAYMSQLRQAPPAFAAQMLRAFVLSQARFVFRNRRVSSSPRKVFGTTALGPLESPWRNATTQDLLSQMEWHAGLAGNAYAFNRNRPGSAIKLLRPDWTGVLWGSESEPDDPANAIDGEIVGYVYRSGGLMGGPGKLQTLDAEDVAHWAPIPDPENPGLGMSWLTPAIRDMQADKAATEHKVKYFTNAATPNLVIKGIPAQTPAQFNELVDAIEQKHAGAANAFRTLYLTAGADATPIGANLKDIDFSTVQGSGETRISVLSRVPAAILGISEGLQGSSLNAGNFSAARRTFADTWVYPNLQNICGSLASIVKVPSDSELWFDTSDIPLLREDGKDAAEIASTDAQTIRNLTDAGFEPESIITAMRAHDWSLLRHSGLFSVQLQPAGSTPAITQGEGA
ncbi:phage portal protein [Kribbella sp. NPDC050470]|uniref:phage portal protein n=1 Tax=unclassified Kribbella TaxID=2644121 RepID=UPI0037A28C61